MNDSFYYLPWIVLALTLWSVPWKGVALYKAARRKDIAWFVILLIVNTIGILEILYIYVFSKKKPSN